MLRLLHIDSVSKLFIKTNSNNVFEVVIKGHVIIVVSHHLIAENILILYNDKSK